MWHLFVSKVLSRYFVCCLYFYFIEVRGWTGVSNGSVGGPLSRLFAFPIILFVICGFYLFRNVRLFDVEKITSFVTFYAKFPDSVQYPEGYVARQWLRHWFRKRYSSKIPRHPIQSTQIKPRFRSGSFNPYLSFFDDFFVTEKILHSSMCRLWNNCHCQ